MSAPAPEYGAATAALTAPEEAAGASAAAEKGSPRKSREKRYRTTALAVRLSPEERERLELAAERAGLAVGSYIRQQVFEGKQPRAVRRVSGEREQIARVLAQLGKIGSNLNQLAKAANMGMFTPADYEMLHQETQGLRAARTTLMEALGRSA